MKTSVAITAVIRLKDIGQDHASFRILIAQTIAGFVVKITAAGKLQNAEQLTNGVFLLKGINYQGFLPVFQCQKADAQVFFYQFIRLCQYIPFELQLINLLPESLDFTEQSILIFLLRGCLSFAHGLISLVTDKVFLPFVPERNADVFALCNFTRGSTSVTELPGGLRSLFRAEAFVCV